MSTTHFSIASKIAMLTKHGKEQILQDTIDGFMQGHDKRLLNTNVVHTNKFDTDELGTFDHTIARKVSAVDTAIKKAYLSCELTACTQGIGSEGSFVSQFGIGLIDEEIIAFVDTVKAIEVVASAKQFVDLAPIHVNDAKTLNMELKRFDEMYQQQQKWMLYQDGSWHKGLSSAQLLSLNETWPTTIEPDFRAMHCPVRRGVIKLAMENLLERLHTYCPRCKHVNFVEKQDPQAYMICEICKQTTNQLQAPKLRCDNCDFVPDAQNTETQGSAFYCSFCNP